jgi:hypothetical protein
MMLPPGLYKKPFTLYKDMQQEKLELEIAKQML